MATSAQKTFALLLNLFCFAALPPKAHGGSGVPLSTNRYTWLSKAEATPVKAVADSKGNVFITGYPLPPYGGYITVAYSSSGLALWTNRYSGSGLPTALTANANGDVIVTGYLGSPITHYEYVTLAYSSTGAPLWTNYYNGPANGYDYAIDLAVDGTGSVFVTGYSEGLGSYDDFATIAYASNGVPLWTNRYNGPSNSHDYASKVAVDTTGKVIVTGRSYDPASRDDYATIAYSATGQPLWTNRYNGPFNLNDRPTSIATDAAGNVFVTGNSYGSNDTQSVCATVAYSTTGALLWTNIFDRPNNAGATAVAVRVDNNCNVFVTTSSVLPSTNADYITIAYSKAGLPLWTNRYDGPTSGTDVATAMAVDGDGNLFVTGYSWSGTSSDYATVAYSNKGAALWTNRYDGIGNTNDIPRDLVVDADGNLFVTGQSPSTGSNWEYVTVRYSTSMQPRLSFQRINSQVIIGWNNSSFGLQAAPDITGTFTNIPAATSPYTNPTTEPRQFFRLISN